MVECLSNRKLDFCRVLTNGMEYFEGRRGRSFLFAKTLCAASVQVLSCLWPALAHRLFVMEDGVPLSQCSCLNVNVSNL